MILFGSRQVSRAIAAGIEVVEIFLRESCETDCETEALETVQQIETEMFSIADDTFDKLMFGDRSDNIVGIAKRPKFGLDEIKLENPDLVLVCQGIEKPGNLGAILRSADACGVSAVLVVDPLTDVYHPNSIRASTGAAFSLQTATASSEEATTWLKAKEFKVFTAQLQGAKEFFQQDLTGNIALVVGNEAHGLDSKWANDSFTPVCLPMLGLADSLNVSVTASVMMYEALRQRATNQERQN